MLAVDQHGLLCLIHHLQERLGLFNTRVRQRWEVDVGNACCCAGGRRHCDCLGYFVAQVDDGFDAEVLAHRDQFVGCKRAGLVDAARCDRDQPVVEHRPFYVAGEC